MGRRAIHSSLGTKPSSHPTLLDSHFSLSQAPARQPNFHSSVQFIGAFLETILGAKGMTEKARILHCNQPEKAMGIAWSRCREFWGFNRKSAATPS